MRSKIAPVFFNPDIEYSKKIVSGLEILTSEKENFQWQGEKARQYVVENFSKDKILANMLIKLKEL